MFFIKISFGSAAIKLVGSFFLVTPIVVTVFDFEAVRIQISIWKY